MASPPAYVAIAGKLTQLIRRGDLPPGAQLPSLDRLAEEHGVSEIVIRQAMGLLRRSGLVHTVPRKGSFVAVRPQLIRVSPERQKESAETSFGNESDLAVAVERTGDHVLAGDQLAEIFGIKPSDNVAHTVTSVREGGTPISISDTYEAGDDRDIAAVTLEETLEDQVPAPGHSAWLGIPADASTKTVRQRYFNRAGQVVMVSDITYARDRYAAFTFTMTLPTDES
ncbi:hypothetical protein Lfu02_62220 [Longispora fulva]|uniref:GntR family transcriptional regulator n=1 Tax=Longispora fulva TaxID=619741 RepID=A0A8J7KUZ4_9ACTN|nr:GntR family transcriptional regulator [Longispora fulva]MBG6134642.1 GntR family transcriptional regulator [Longispora fulva]GIG61850.1 hypothetical protein Lfu02_62220 [Longispora fulva]